MKKFKFKLEPLKHHRSVIEKEKRVQLSKSMAELRQVEAKLIEIDQAEIDARKQFAALGSRFDSSPLTSSQFWVIDNFISGQKVRRKIAKEDLAIKESNLQRDYSTYVKAKQDLKVMETLEDKERARYKKARAKYESKQIDELYTMRDRLSVRHDKQGDSNEE